MIRQMIISITLAVSLALAGCGGTQKADSETIRKAAIAAAGLAIGGYIYWRSRPTKPTFVTACNIPVYAPNHDLSAEYRDDMKKVIMAHVDEHASGDCKRLAGVNILFAEMGFPCKASPSGKCAGTYNPRTNFIVLGYAEPFSKTAIKTELEHHIHGAEGLWDHKFSPHVE